MKTILLATVLLLSSNLPASASWISENVAVLIARAYVVGLDYPMEGSVEEEISRAEKVDSSGYTFFVIDTSGDCGLTIFVNKDGSINQNKTKNKCY